jgi:membrane fusion protein, multidrug efflux system
VLPQQAVLRSSLGDSVMVVAADGKVAPRSVKIGSAQGNDWVVLDGLKAGEKVMVDGFQKLRGDALVKPVAWQPAASAPAAQAPSASAAASAR